MTDWFRVDTGFASHRKVRRLSDGAFRLHVAAMCRVGNDETDGLLTAEDLADAALDARQPERKIPGLVDELVMRDLWDEVLGGDAWLIHDWLDLNPSHEALDAGRRANRERLQAWRRRKAAEQAGDQGDDPGNGVSPGAGNGVSNGVANGVRNATTVRNGTVRNGTVRSSPGSPSSSTEPKRLDGALADLGWTDDTTTHDDPKA